MSHNLLFEERFRYRGQRLTYAASSWVFVSDSLLLAVESVRVSLNVELINFLL